jgi:hypothetical protein
LPKPSKLILDGFGGARLNVNDQKGADKPVKETNQQQRQDMQNAVNGMSRQTVTALLIYALTTKEKRRRPPPKNT